MNKNTLPMANAVPKGMNEERLNKLIMESNLTGLANNTKWNELINYIRKKDGWRPAWRSKSINGYISEWDVEWEYHLPFPFKLVLWFDIGCYEEEYKPKLLDKEITDHSNELINVIESIGFEYEKNNDIIRIFGYGPKDYDLFE